MKDSRRASDTPTELGDTSSVQGAVAGVAGSDSPSFLAPAGLSHEPAPPPEGVAHGALGGLPGFHADPAVAVLELRPGVTVELLETPAGVEDLVALEHKVRFVAWVDPAKRDALIERLEALANEADEGSDKLRREGVASEPHFRGRAIAYQHAANLVRELLGGAS